MVLLSLSKMQNIGKNSLGKKKKKKKKIQEVSLVGAMCLEAIF